MLSSAIIILALAPSFIYCAPQLYTSPAAQVATDSTLISIASSTTSTSPSSSAVPPPVTTQEPQIVPMSSSSETVFDLPPVEQPLVMAYYPDWVSATYPPEKIDFKRFHIIDFAFAVLDKNFNITWDDPDMGPALLRRLVTAAHAEGCKVKLSIGGWSGSQNFSPAVASDECRQSLVAKILAVYEQFNIDGIDIDWEYPGHEGNAGNQYTGSDTANLLSFFQLLRYTLPPAAIITAAVQTTTFVDPHSQPMKDVSEFAKVLDWALIMNYDAWGSSSTPGPNAALWDGCGNSTQSDANAVSAFNAWTTAGFPANKLVLGLPAYGYVSTSSETKLRTRSNAFTRDDVSQPVQSDDGGPNGEISFRNLVAQNALVRSPSDNNTFVGSGGCESQWDDCSATPFLVCNGQVVSYDDYRSIHMKAQFVKNSGMRGVNFWTVDGDTDDWDLSNAVMDAFGYM